MTSKAIENIEANEKVAEMFLEILEDYVEGQIEIFRLISVLNKIGPKLDDPKERARAELSTFANFDNDEYDRIWIAFTTLINDSDEPEDRIDSSDEGQLDSARNRSEMSKEIDKLFAVLPDGLEHAYMHSMIKSAVRQPSSSRIILSSLLTSMVSRFETMIAKVVRLMLVNNPGALNGERKTFDWATVSGYESLSDFKNHVIDTVVDDLMYKGADEWKAYLSGRFKIASPPVLESSEFQELIQRRHLFVHNDGTVNSRYLQKAGVSGQGRTAGEALTVDENYLKNSVDVLIAAGVAVIAACALKTPAVKADPDPIDNAYTELTYRMLQLERYGCIGLLQSNCPPAIDNIEGAGLTRRVNYWLALKRQNQIDSVRKEIESWRVQTLTEEYQLAKYALLDDFEAAMGILISIRGTSKLTLRDWLQWPLLDELREFERNLEDS